MPIWKHTDQKLKSQGFSLAELLIAVMILGEIATFTVPKVLVAQKNAHDNAVFKETVAAAQNTIIMSMQLGDFRSGYYACGTGRPESIDLTKFGARLNYVKKDESTGIKWYWLSNGAKIGFYLGNHIDTIVDVNGDDQPNTYGIDKIIYHYADCSGSQAGIPGGKFGTISTQPVGYVAENKALWESIFINN